MSLKSQAVLPDVNNRSIGVKLGIAFGSLIILLGGVGGVSLLQMNRINRDLDRVVNHRWAKANLAREAVNISNLNNRITMQVFMTRAAHEITSLVTQADQTSTRTSLA